VDWSDSAEQAGFRTQVRDLITDKLPERYHDSPERAHNLERPWEFDRASKDAAAREAAVAWSDALAERRWVAPHWPEEYGGAGLSPMEQFILKQEIAEAGAPAVGGSGLHMLGPTLILNGSEEQRREHLPRILSGEATWAQGFSEPGAGSDLASLATRARRDGDELVINGQKIWTSAAHTADWFFLLARTDPDAPKHRGISFLLAHADTPGITVQPLVDMTDVHYFNETFFEEVRIPVANIVGEENRGWYVAMNLLDFERSNIEGAVHARRSIHKLLGYAASAEGAARSRLTASPALRIDLAERYVETEVMFQFSARIISMQHAGLVPNYEASTAKLYASELNQRLALTSMRAFGQYGALWGQGTPEGPTSPHAPLGGAYPYNYLRAVPGTIRGGTSEVQRNIIATRGLGLPRG
jgi:alkylation response protein AidB-like acyl-CoA dehydrogenase